MKDDFNKELDGDLQIVRKNPLIEFKMATSMKTLEYKLLLTAMSKITRSDLEIPIVRFELKEFYKIAKIKNDSNMDNHLIKVCEGLYDKKSLIRTEKGWKMFHWLHHIELIDKTIEIQFHDCLKDKLLFVTENAGYTKILLQNIMNFSTISTIRIYDLLKQYESIGRRKISVEDIRAYLGKSNTYKIFADFRKRFLVPAEEEINALSDITYKFKSIPNVKNGIKIEFIEFYNIKSKKRTSVVLTRKQAITELSKILKERYSLHFSDITYSKVSLIAITKLIDDLLDGKFEKSIIRQPGGFFSWQLMEYNSMYVESKKDEESQSDSQVAEEN